MDELYLVRHCASTGQAPDAPLTEAGFAQARALATALPRGCVDRIICSPYKRAIQSVTPFAELNRLPIELDDRLRERSLNIRDSDAWREVLAASFEDLD